MSDWLKDHAGLCYMALGCVCGWVMAMLRSGGFTTKDLRSRITDACMCSMLTSALWLVGTYYFHIADELAIPIGTFIGFLGTDFVRLLIKGYIKTKSGNDEL